ncbi:hypothetical protein Cgig2_009694 [Carnegiea gigantea]|uniref:Uncharacterized protein n=1 Tax=Carnegiea gigantea TaxID=171969 RepID=A0A9Q1QD51_9CARY|nr:hypothetical protein Cgig2_009694 [Carnegiea gigantea]
MLTSGQLRVAVREKWGQRVEGLPMGLRSQPPQRHQAALKGSHPSLSNFKFTVQEAQPFYIAELSGESYVLVRNVPPDPHESVSEHVEHFFCVNHPDHYLLHQKRALRKLEAPVNGTTHTAGANSHLTGATDSAGSSNNLPSQSNSRQHSLGRV